MLLSQIIATLRADGDHWLADTDASWTQGRTLFGGLQAALLVAAMRRSVPADMPLRSLQVTFVGPVPGGTVRMRTQVLRQGKSTVHAQAQTVDDSGIGCTAIAVFGRARPSLLSFAPPYPAVPRAPEESPGNFRIPGLTPDFLQYADQRFAAGGLPFSGAAEPRTQIFVRYPGETVTTESLVLAIADTIPSPAISVLKKLAPASSMTWTLELFSEDLSAIPLGYWLMDAQVTAGANGYVAQTADLWSPERQLVGHSRQSVVVFG